MGACVAAWLLGGVAAWVCACLGACLGAWLRGYLWLHGCLGAWLRGCLAA